MRSIVVVIHVLLCFVFSTLSRTIKSTLHVSCSLCCVPSSIFTGLHYPISTIPSRSVRPLVFGLLCVAGLRIALSLLCFVRLVYMFQRRRRNDIFVCSPQSVVCRVVPFGFSLSPYIGPQQSPAAANKT